MDPVIKRIMSTLVVVSAAGLIGLSVSTVTLAAVVHVPSESPTIQAGIDAASAGDTVLVADGVYTGLGNRGIDFLGKSVVLSSENGSESCVIDCQDASLAFVLQSGEDSTCVIEGFAIRNGFGWMWGGAMYIADASPTIRNCVFSGNMAHDGSGTAGGGEGAAIYCIRGSPTIEDCAFNDNLARYASPMDISLGGAIYFRESSPTLTRCSFKGNYALIGGSIYARDCNLSLEDCALRDNSLEGHCESGGGLHLWACTTAFSDCVFEGNFGGYGGAVLSFASTMTLTSCLFEGNSAWKGGAVYQSLSSATYSNCTFTQDSSSSSAAAIRATVASTVIAMQSIFAFQYLRGGNRLH